MLLFRCVALSLCRSFERVPYKLAIMTMPSLPIPCSVQPCYSRRGNLQAVLRRLSAFSDYSWKLDVTYRTVIALDGPFSITISDKAPQLYL